MTTAASGDVYYDLHDASLGADPHAVFRRLRDEAPLYYNEEYDFYALSRYDDVEAALARLESVIALEHLLDFMPRYEVDWDGLHRVTMQNVAGYHNVPVRVLK